MQVDFSDKPYSLFSKIKNTLEAYQPTSQPKKYKNILQSILNPKSGTPEPRALAPFPVILLLIP